MVNPNDYSREERQKEYRMGSAKRTGIRKAFLPRMLLLDLLFLVLLLVVFTPMMRNGGKRSVRLGDYELILRQKRRNDSLILGLEISLEAESGKEVNVGWMLLSDDGEMFHEEMDLAPEPGQVRRFAYSADVSETLRIRVLADGLEHEWNAGK